jgi:hypothetical protein
LSSPDALSQPDKAGQAEHTAMIANAIVDFETVWFISSAPGLRPISWKARSQRDGKACTRSPDVSASR